MVPSWVRLSPKSLELCTENLGNETGTNITDNTIDHFLSSSSSHSLSRTTNEPRKKLHQARTFPPPLTTIRVIRVTPQREPGRLVLQLTKIMGSRGEAAPEEKKVTIKTIVC
ncbi:hypothetical protein VNO78_07494 [Psophocarpus tetragonolobus]|uniref:Uncharacterized protein n=1 Tax=Psophocarpus tetragonolobus TaxID=3891 RepID=A0AAN9T393_PSOTE